MIDKKNKLLKIKIIKKYLFSYLILSIFFVESGFSSSLDDELFISEKITSKFEESLGKIIPHDSFNVFVSVKIDETYQEIQKEYHEFEKTDGRDEKKLSMPGFESRKNKEKDKNKIIETSKKNEFVSRKIIKSATVIFVSDLTLDNDMMSIIQDILKAPFRELSPENLKISYKNSKFVKNERPSEPVVKKDDEFISMEMISLWTVLIGIAIFIVVLILIFMRSNSKKSDQRKEIQDKKTNDQPSENLTGSVDHSSKIHDDQAENMLSEKDVSFVTSAFKAAPSHFKYEFLEQLGTQQFSYLVTNLQESEKAELLKTIINKDKEIESLSKNLKSNESTFKNWIDEFSQIMHQSLSVKEKIEHFFDLDEFLNKTMDTIKMSEEDRKKYGVDKFIADYDVMIDSLSSKQLEELVGSLSNETLSWVASIVNVDSREAILRLTKGIRKKSIENIMSHGISSYGSLGRKEFIELYRKLKK